MESTKCGAIAKTEHARETTGDFELWRGENVLGLLSPPPSSLDGSFVLTCTFERAKDLGILNPIYGRKHNKPEVHQTKATRKVTMSGEGGKGRPQVGRAHWRGRGGARGECGERRP